MDLTGAISVLAPSQLSEPISFEIYFPRRLAVTFVDRV